MRQFRDSTDVVVKIGWNTVRRQLLKGQQNLVCFNCCRGILTAKLWLTCGARPFSCFPDEVLGSSRESLLGLMSSCEDTDEFLLLLLSPCGENLLPVGCSDNQSGEKNISLRGWDRPRIDPQWFPGFLNYCSWMFPDQLRNKSELVGSEETRQVSKRHPRYETLSYWILLRVFLVTLPLISSKTWEM